jgi:hypothetical protein
MAKNKTIAKILLMLSAAYPSARLADETPVLYERLLADISDEVLEAAVMDHIARSPFYPKVSELRQAAAEIAANTRAIPPAAEAWGEVARLIPAYGRDRPPQIENPISAQVVAALGWRNLCLSTNQVADRARFIEAYNEYKRRAADQYVTLPAVRQLAASLRMPGLPPGQLPAEAGPETGGEPAPPAQWAPDYAELVEQFRAEAFDTGEHGSLTADF